MALLPGLAPVPLNPFARTLTAHKKQHQAAVRPEELPELLRAIADYDGISDQQTRLALQRLAQTFVRTNELITYRRGVGRVRSGQRLVGYSCRAHEDEYRACCPLSRQALAILAELKEISSGSCFVFPRRNRDKPINNNTILLAPYRLGYKGKMTDPGFRVVASTILNETGFNPDVIERQLAHCEVRSAYTQAEYLSERKRMMQYWADYLDSAEAGAKVITLQDKHDSG